MTKQKVNFRNSNNANITMAAIIFPIAVRCLQTSYALCSSGTLSRLKASVFRGNN